MRLIRTLLSVLLLSYPLYCIGALSSIALDYSSHPPLERLRSYDVIVVNPNPSIDPAAYHHPNSELYAYVSVGEASNTDTYYHQMSPRCFIGQNPIWHAQVLDQADPACRQFFVDKVITPLWNKGYHGFFLDTLDSYTLSAKDDKARQQQIQGLVQLIKDIKTKYPAANLVFNRGFELVPYLKDQVYAVTGESLFAGWNETKKQYEPVSAENRQYLLNQFALLQKMNIPVVSIDYLPPGETQERDRLAKKIAALGIIPWVTDGHLVTMGKGYLDPLPRKLFTIYNKAPSTLFNPAVHLLLSFPAQYMGYTLEYHDVTQPLPDSFNAEDYAGIIVWAIPPTPEDKQRLHTWLVKQLKTRVPIVFFETFGFDMTNELLAPFGLSIDTVIGHVKSVRITKNDKRVIGYEVPPLATHHDFIPLHARGSAVLLQLTSLDQQAEDAVAVTPWGGYALSNFVEIGAPQGNNFWVLNPFTWLQRTLRLPQMPVPDVTTENGRRLMFIHIDGDAFSSLAEWKGGKIGALELKERIFDKYQVPTTFSVIEGEIFPKGLYPAQSPELEKAAKEIFALPWIEAASHTFSHPFDWILAATTKTGTHNLPIPNYHFNTRTEIQGSLDYISNKLTPPGKKAKVLLWSGFANPNEKTVGLTYEADVGNMNGYGSSITYAFQSLTAVGPIGLRLGRYYQVYAPTSNEEAYTNTWSGPYYGFQRVIETFELTENPVRYNPIDIYYHIYSAIKPAGLIALNKVYQWALAQPVHNIYASDYIKKAMDLDSAGIAKYNDGWQISTNGNVREIRAAQSMGYPDLERSTNVIGFNAFHDMFYIHLGTATKTLLFFTKKSPALPYLASANGAILRFARTDNNRSLTLRLKGNLPLIFSLANIDHCTVEQSRATLKGPAQNNAIVFHINNKDSDDIRIKC